MFKRKHSNLDEEEARLSHLLFKKSKDLIEKIKPLDQNQHEFDLKPVWIDEDDVQFTANNANTQYSEKLKQRYETLIGTPEWAKLNKKLTEDEEDNNEILRTVGHLHKKKMVNLPKDLLEIKMLPQINADTRNEGRLISQIEFHPKLSVSLVAGNAGVVSLFSIGGDSNNKLHSFQLKKWRVTAAQFTPSGTEAYISTNQNDHYCVYDLIKAETKLVQLPFVVKKPKMFKLSPDGKYIAASSSFDEIYLISSASKELLRSLKHNSNVAAFTFSPNSDQLYCYGIQGEITVWDLSTFKAIKKFFDHGCVNASCITTSLCGRLLATGSREGIVNIYETSKIDSTEPCPTKTISNLTTRIDNLKFNATSEILATSSEVIPNAIKLVHIPSYHVFTNFPTTSESSCRIYSVNFSPNSGYMAVGNDKGQANLFRLKYYQNY